MANKYEEALDGAHGIEFDEFKFDSPDFRSLIVTEENFLDHLRVQAAGLAYYSMLAKQAERECSELEERYKARYNEMYSECSSIILRAGQKSTVKDVDSFVREKYESEIEKWSSALSEARSKRDALASYYEGWRNKGFALSSMTSLVTAGLLGPKTVISEDDLGRMADRRMNASTARGILSSPGSDSHRYFK